MFSTLTNYEEADAGYDESSTARFTKGFERPWCHYGSVIKKREKKEKKIRGKKTYNTKD